MARGHPVDSGGRVLPEPSWPPDKHAPGDLEFVRRFCNTTNLESGADLLTDPDDLDRWLRDHGRPGVCATGAELAGLRELREVLRHAAIAHRDGETDDDAMRELERHLAPVALRFRRGAAALPIGTDVPAETTQHLIAMIAIQIVGAIATGTWSRLKACSHCRWVVYDSSRNRSGRWCSMSACGGRAKVRDHRARQRLSKQ